MKQVEDTVTIAAGIWKVERADRTRELSQYFRLDLDALKVRYE